MSYEPEADALRIEVGKKPKAAILLDSRHKKLLMPVSC